MDRPVIGSVLLLVGGVNNIRKYSIMNIILFIFLIFVFSFSTYAQVTSEIEIMNLKGYTQYEIGGYLYGFRSLLEFPFDSNFIGGSLQYQKEDSNGNIQLSAWTNLKGKAGYMEDSDWLYDYGVEGRDIYSISGAYLERSYIFNLETNYDYTYNDRITISPKGGYKFQNFKYTIKDGIQYGGLTENGEYISKDYYYVLSGELLKYNVNYNIPYIGFDVSYASKKIDMRTGFAISPYIKASDKDDHLLRDKMSYGNSQGNGVMFNSSFGYNITTQLKFEGKFNYLKINTDGTQDQYFYDSDSEYYYGSVSNEINTIQKNFIFGLSYIFN